MDNHIFTAIIFFMSTPWVQFVRILSGKKIAMKDALPVYTKCNLMKYVPGNVFQYVGRNQLAADLHISHVDVACATVLEILCSGGSAGVDPAAHGKRHGGTDPHL